MAFATCDNAVACGDAIACDDEAACADCMVRTDAVATTDPTIGCDASLQAQQATHRKSDKILLAAHHLGKVLHLFPPGLRPEQSIQTNLTHKPRRPHRQPQSMRDKACEGQTLRDEMAVRMCVRRDATG